MMVESVIREVAVTNSVIQQPHVSKVTNPISSVQSSFGSFIEKMRSPALSEVETKIPAKPSKVKSRNAYQI